MAHLANCDTCGCRLLDSYRCEECETAVLLDIIYRVQRHLKRSPDGSGFPKALKEDILEIEAQSLSSFLSEKRRGDSRQAIRNAEKQVRDLELVEELQKTRDKFRRKYPDPNEPTY